MSVMMQTEVSGMLKNLDPAAAEHVRSVLQQWVADSERRAGGSGATTRGSAQALPPPRRSMPKGLLAAGGHDIGWRSLR